MEFRYFRKLRLNKKRVKKEGGIELTKKFLNSTEIAHLPLYYLKQKNKTIIMPISDISEDIGTGTHDFE